MKKLLTLLATLVFASVAQAGIMLNGVDVGDADTLNDIATKEDMGNFGDGTEIAWGNDVWGTSYTDSDYVKDQSVSYELTTYEGVEYLAFELDSEPGHYLVKNSTYAAFFTNNALYNWAVIATSELGDGFNIGTSSLIISHVSSFGGSVSVPEPATIGLFALGLVGLSAARRRKTA